MEYSINEKIRIIRNIRGYKQSYMASKLNISQQDYSYLENQAKALTNEQITILATNLEVSETFLYELNPDILLNEIQHEQKEKNNISLGNFEDEDREKKIIVLLNEKISLMEKNLSGLRNQIREQNETIRDLRKLLVEE